MIPKKAYQIFVRLSLLCYSTSELAGLLILRTVNRVLEINENLFYVVNGGEEILSPCLFYVANV
jgi:hypothetical protein